MQETIKKCYRYSEDDATRCTAYTFYDRIVDKTIFMIIVHHTFNKSSKTDTERNAYFINEHET